jgi:hypothetical protein
VTTSKLWTPLTILLLVIIAVTGIMAWSRFSASQAAEISITRDYPTRELPNRIYISGAVLSPGCYPLRVNDSIEALI